MLPQINLGKKKKTTIKIRWKSEFCRHPNCKALFFERNSYKRKMSLSFANILWQEWSRLSWGQKTGQHDQSTSSNAAPAMPCSVNQPSTAMFVWRSQWSPWVLSTPSIYHKKKAHPSTSSHLIQTPNVNKIVLPLFIDSFTHSCSIS